MEMGDIMDRCVDAMGSAMGSGMMGKGLILVLVLFLLLVVWVIGLVVVGAVLFWAIRNLSETRFGNS
jgi:hypothetical protein